MAPAPEFRTGRAQAQRLTPGPATEAEQAELAAQYQRQIEPYRVRSFLPTDRTQWPAGLIRLDRLPVTEMTRQPIIATYFTALDEAHQCRHVYLNVRCSRGQNHEGAHAFCAYLCSWRWFNGAEGDSLFQSLRPGSTVCWRNYEGAILGQWAI
jgi:hypothetical protein